MGLDTGIHLKGKVDPETLPWFVKIEECKFTDGDETEVCYWRKCWGIDREIAAVLHCPDNGIVAVEFEDIPAIERVLEKYMSESYWDEHGDSIWTYEESLSFQGRNLKNLLWLGQYLKEHPDAECYFYESY